MKVFTDIDDYLGKKVFRDPRLEKAKEKFKSAKATFLSIEFTNEDIASCDCLLISEDKLFDIIVDDMAKAETVLESKDDPVFKEVLEVLSSEKPLSQVMDRAKLDSIKEYSFITAKPLICFKSTPEAIPFENILKVTSSIAFFTIGPKEARAWLVKEQSTIVEAAAKIHTDLARGFIRAEVYNIKEMDSFHNIEEAKQKGILKIVDKDYIVNDGDVINVRFNVSK